MHHPSFIIHRSSSIVHHALPVARRSFLSMPFVHRSTGVERCALLIVSCPDIVVLYIEMPPVKI